MLEHLLEGGPRAWIPTSAVCSSSSNPPAWPGSPGRLGLGRLRPGSEAVLDRAAEGGPDVLDVLVGATRGEGLEALHHLGRGVVALGVGQQGLPVGRERAGGEEPGDVAPGLGVVQVEGRGRGPPPARRASGVGWPSPGPSCSRCSSTRLSTGAPCCSERVSWSSSSSSRGCACRFLAPRCPLLRSLLLLADGLGQLGLAHAGAALDPELLGPLVQLLPGVPDGVDAGVRPAPLRAALRAWPPAGRTGPSASWAPSGRPSSRTSASRPRRRCGGPAPPPRRSRPPSRGPCGRCASPWPGTAARCPAGLVIVLRHGRLLMVDRPGCYPPGTAISRPNLLVQV